MMCVVSVEQQNVDETWLLHASNLGKSCYLGMCTKYFFALQKANPFPLWRLLNGMTHMAILEYRKNKNNDKASPRWSNLVENISI